MSNTVYLVVEDMSGVIDDAIIDLFNARHSGLGELAYSSTYADMKSFKETNAPIKGAGYIRKKDGADRWVLPFYSHPDMFAPDNAEVLSISELKNYGWDPEVFE